MSRALFSTTLILSIFALGHTAAEADPSRHAGQGLRPVTALRPVSDGAPHAGYRRSERTTPAQFYTQPVWRESAPIVLVQRNAAARPKIEPLSVSPVEPGAVVSRTASGRVAIGPPPGLYGIPAGVVIDAVPERPYAQPAFHIIGAPSTRDMGSPVRLTYGVKPPESFRPGPKVVWLDASGRDAQGGDSPHVKRLR